MKDQLSSQGIKGPSYRFFHGSTKEITNMKKEAMSRPMNLSHDIFSTILPHVHSWVDKYELIKEIMNNRDNNYPKPETAPYTKKLLGDGLGTSEGAKWAKMRKLANSAFNAECLKNMIPSMISSIEVMLEGWKHHEGKEIEVSEEFKLLTSEVISRTAFGSSYLREEHFSDVDEIGLDIIQKCL
ncbi:cytochrome P450 CYP749A22-like isoform X2 [Quercus suber]|uniref:cytochrome P450 CYP749A22-like isoform X2 n=1 Tax=Quercus suber TaxID=58331 RepID=UPI0032DFF5EA